MYYQNHRVHHYLKKILNTNSITSVPGSSKKIGTSLSSHIYEKSKYFSNAKISNQSLKHIFSENDSPIEYNAANNFKNLSKANVLCK